MGTLQWFFKIYFKGKGLGVGFYKIIQGEKTSFDLRAETQKAKQGLFTLAYRFQRE